MGYTLVMRRLPNGGYMKKTLEGLLREFEARLADGIGCDPVDLERYVKEIKAVL
jgi:hypothetical protein